MLVTVKGTYANGIIQLSEPGPAAPAEVLVTFLEIGTEAEKLSAAVRQPEGAANENMARLFASWEQARLLLGNMQGRSLSDEVLAERSEEGPA